MAQQLKGCASLAKDPSSAVSTNTVRSQHDFSFMSIGCLVAQTHILTQLKGPPTMKMKITVTVEQDVA